MRVAGDLYFAPGVTFSELGLDDDEELVDHLAQRIKGYYLSPARELVKSGHAFASGVIIVTCIDALSRFEYGPGTGTGDRFPDWCTSKLHSFENGYSRRFYRNFRNGLIHESRIKDGGEFTLEIEQTITESEEVLSINPALLIEEVTETFELYIEQLSSNVEEIEEVRDIICSDFEYELTE